jgi:hypothetical protein
MFGIGDHRAYPKIGKVPSSVYIMQFAHMKPWALILFFRYSLHFYDQIVAICVKPKPSCHLASFLFSSENFIAEHQ